MCYDQKECGRRMARLRGRHHLVQEEAAEKLGISVFHYRALENGRKGASIDLLIELIDIAGMYECSLDYLIIGRATASDNAWIRKELQAAVGQLDALLEML